MFDINKLVIDKVRRVTGRSRETGELYFVTGQVQDPSLQCDANEVIKTDAEEVPVARWMNGKTATFSGSETFCDLSLMSEQLNGEEKHVATDTAPMNAPAMEETVLTAADLTEYTLKHPAVNFGTTSVPNYRITVCTLSPDGSRDKKFTVGLAVDDNTCTYTAADHKLTFKEGSLAVGDKLFVQYEYSAKNCVVVYDSADKYPREMEMVLEVLTHPVCSSETVYVGYIVFPKATLSPSVTYALGKTDPFPFSFSAQQDYCDNNKQLFRIVVPEDSEE